MREDIQNCCIQDHEDMHVKACHAQERRAEQNRTEQNGTGERKKQRQRSNTIHLIPLRLTAQKHHPESGKGVFYTTPTPHAV